jgi:hypothetical protein
VTAGRRTSGDERRTFGGEQWASDGEQRISGGGCAETASGDRARSAVLVRLPDGRIYEGPTVDLRGIDPAEPSETTLSPPALRRAIRAGCPAPPDAPAVYAPSPGRVHAHVARLARDVSLRRRPALAAVAAARGIETPYDDDLAAARRTLRESEAAVPDVAQLREARRRAAEAGSETDRLRERVATIRGRVNALREERGDDGAVGGEVGDAETPLSEATRRLSEATRQLSEVATERVAADQRLALLEKRAREARDERDARLRLEDRVGNLERAAREARVAAVADEFHSARRGLASRLPGERSAGASLSEGLRDALAIARIAPLRAPVVATGEVVAALGGVDPAFVYLDAPLVVR